MKIGSLVVLTCSVGYASKVGIGLFAVLKTFSQCYRFLFENLPIFVLVFVCRMWFPTVRSLPKRTRSSCLT
jgi:uncharacterized membrane protein